jgi:hypothetical protein
LIQNTSDLERGRFDFWKTISFFHPQSWGSWSTEKRIEHSALVIQSLRDGSSKPLLRHKFKEHHFMKLPSGTIKEFQRTSLIFAQPIWKTRSSKELKERRRIFKQFGTDIVFELVEISGY